MDQLLSKLLELLSKNYKVAIFSMLLTLSMLYALLNSLFGVNLDNLTVFVLQNQKSIDTVAEELNQINGEIDQAELVSYENQQDMLKIVQKQLGLQGSDNQINFGRLLNLSNENQDIIRAQFEFGRIYATLVKSRKGNKKTHENLSKMYQALLLVTLDNPLDDKLDFNNSTLRKKAQRQKESICSFSKAKSSPICKAKNLLVDLRKNINDFPDNVRDNIKIEIYRYLSYCSARALELNNQIKYTKLAEKILNAKPSLSDDDPKLYRRQYYWVDYSRLLSVVKEGNTNFEEQAKIYFEKLNNGLEGEFLKMKLLQHQNLIPEERRYFWKKLIGKASAS